MDSHWISGFREDSNQVIWVTSAAPEFCPGFENSIERHRFVKSGDQQWHSMKYCYAKR